MSVTPSMYEGAGGQGTRISSSNPVLFYESCRYDPADDFKFYDLGNDKTVMQNLNDRLAFFIQKVQSLKSTNVELQWKINEWSASHTAESRDYSEYLTTIKSLQDQIQHMSKSNKEIALNIQNAILAADDFRTMYETELAFRMSLDMDTAFSRKLMDEITLTRSTLEMEYESLKEEHILLQKTHKEEKARIQAKSGHQVNISVDAAPSTDLNETLTKIREHYENVVAKNRKDLDVWCQKKISAMEKTCTEQTDDLKNTTTEVRKLQTYFNKLQIEHDAQESLSMSLNASLQDTATHYKVQLANFQKIITDLESKLKQIHANIIAKKKEYENLDTEIKQYRILLEEVNRDFQGARKKIAVLEVVERTESVTIR